ncbi:MAG: hypothetical protein KAT46_07745, partial [Deltaproteobacteria bacterium]|nr:hypothetical protein [Deltaproteobacteria bacterium]
MNEAKASNERMISELGRAIRTEAEGHLFYSEAAKLTGDPKGREVFLHLASEELEHMHVIISLVEALENGEEWPYYPDALAEGMKKEHPIFPG